MASIGYWTCSVYMAYYICRMICDLNSLLKRKYVGSILVISEVINVLSKHNQEICKSPPGKIYRISLFLNSEFQ